LYIPCYNPEEVLDEFRKINLEPEQSILYDLKKLISISVEKSKIIPDTKVHKQIVDQICPIEKNSINPEEEINNKNRRDVEESDKAVSLQENHKVVIADETKIVIDKQRLMFLENISFKIAEETQQVSHILNKLQSFKTNIHRANKNIDSLKKYKHSNHTPNVIQSERPRGKTVSVWKDQIDTSVFTIEECKIWVKNKSINPKTSRKIEENGPTYKRIQTIAKMYKLL
jgi:hypothetical protein